MNKEYEKELLEYKIILDEMAEEKESYLYIRYAISKIGWLIVNPNYKVKKSRNYTS